MDTRRFLEIWSERALASGVHQPTRTVICCLGCFGDVGGMQTSESSECMDQGFLRLRDASHVLLVPAVAGFTLLPFPGMKLARRLSHIAPTRPHAYTMAMSAMTGLAGLTSKAVHGLPHRGRRMSKSLSIRCQAVFVMADMSEARVPRSKVTTLPPHRQSWLQKLEICQTYSSSRDVG